MLASSFATAGGLTARRLRRIDGHTQEVVLRVHGKLPAPGRYEVVVTEGRHRLGHRGVTVH